MLQRTRAQFTIVRQHAQKDALAHTQHTTHTSTCVHRRRRRLRWTARQPTSGGRSSQNRIRQAWTSSVASPTTCCSSSSASSPPNLPCGPPALPAVAPPLALRPPQPHRRQLPLRRGLQTHGRSLQDPFITTCNIAMSYSYVFKILGIKQVLSW